MLALTEIGEGEDALICKTDREGCCKTRLNRIGEFYYPNGVKIPINKRGEKLYRNRGEKEVRLNRKEGAVSPIGRFHCEIPDAKGVMQSLYITLI